MLDTIEPETFWGHDRNGNLIRWNSQEKYDRHHDGQDDADDYKRPDSTRCRDIQARLLHLSAIEPVLSISYLVKGWLSAGGYSIIYGPSNAGKTFVALDMAMHLAA